MQLNLGNKIRELRRRDSRTQEALADALGVTSQAVSRWEMGGSYPDMEIIPSIANYFGISIDELFGYDNERTKKIDMLVSKIDDMNRENNGVDINITECIALARAAMLEFPENEKIMLCLASVLFNAGYVRYGEYHLTDADGYNIYDTKRHRTYAEWTEAIALYEKVLKTMPNGEDRYRAVRELIQLYLNIGETEKALAFTENVPTIYDSREFLQTNAFDGERRARAFGEVLLKTVRACAELAVSTVIVYETNMTPAEKAESLRGAVALFSHICTDGNYGKHHAYIARIYTLLSVYLWLDGKHDEAFEALDDALVHFQRCQNAARDTFSYTAPLVRLVHEDAWKMSDSMLSLAEDWPWWCVPEYKTVKTAIQADPRWTEWVSKLRE